MNGRVDKNAASVPHEAPMKVFDAGKRSFLVSCVGTYDGSGLGTGGLVCIHRRKAIVLDKMDCTGLSRSGTTVYRYVRPMRAIIGYTCHGLHFLLRAPDPRDVHDLQMTEAGFVCVSTGSNEVLWLDPFGQVRRRWRANGHRDAWHLNCLEMHNGSPHVSAFGEFEEHRGWLYKNSGTGFLIDIATGQKKLQGLTGPHSPRFFDGKWHVCESHLSTLTVIDAGGAARRIRLKGFTRGLAYDAEHIFVGESKNRTAPAGADSCIVVLDRRTHEVVDRVPVPFPEIYDIVTIPDEFGENMATAPEDFRFEFNAERIAFLEEQMAELRSQILLKYEGEASFRRRLRKRLATVFSIPAAAINRAWSALGAETPEGSE